MNTGTTVATSPDAAIIGRLIPLDSDYYRRNVSTHSHEASMVPYMPYKDFENYPGHLLPGSALRGYLRPGHGASTVPVDAETIRKIFSEAPRIHSELRREAKEIQFDLRSPSHTTIATSRPNESLSGIVASVRRHPRLRFRERLATRLERLIEISREEQPEQPPPALASVQDMIAFLAANPDLSYATTVLTPNGNIRLEWRRARDQHFAIEFLGDLDVRFVVFAPDPKRPFKVARVSGQAALDSVMTLVAPYGVRDWSAGQDEERPAV
jgi:hypothetical protein